MQFQKSGGSSGSNDRGDLASQAKQNKIHMVPQCKTTCSVRLSVRTLAFHAGKEGFDSPTEHHCFYSQASIRYRVQTCTLFGSQRPATDPDITASALERKHRTPKLAFSVLDYKNMHRWQSGQMQRIANP